MQISKNKVVTLTYKLSSNLPGDEKKHVETADSSSPLVFLFGSGMMIPGFEKNLEGKSNGDQFSFSIKSDDAYGAKDSSAIVQLPIDIFKVDGVVDLNLLQVGKILPLNDQDGNVLQGQVKSYDDKTVTMDFNHPLAGHELHFAGEIIGIREASPEEISHGHVH
jgi:FKBP-type peptidyl-prolyl cis-trans isomerase SlyD